MATMTSQQLRDYEARMYSHKHVQKVLSGEFPVTSPVEDEASLQYRIIQYCRSKGWLPVFSGMHRKTSTPVGTPDFTIYADGGRVFTIETKSRSGKQTTEQRGAQLMLEKLGHRYYLIRSFEEFLAIVIP